MSHPYRYRVRYTGGLSVQWDAHDDHAARADVALWRDTAYPDRTPLELHALDGAAGPERAVPLSQPVLPHPPVTSRSV